MTVFECIGQLPSQQLNLANHEIHLWNVSLQQSQKVVSEFNRMLSLEETARANRFYFEKDKNRFILGRGGLRKILSFYLQTKPEKLQIEVTKDGKPFLGNSEHASITFNLSHSDDLALIAVSLHREIGIDLERLRPLTDLQHMIRRFFSSGECSAILSLPEEKQSAAFFQHWTAKEACLKAMGTGIRRPLNQVELLLNRDSLEEQVRVTEEGKQDAYWHIYRLRMKNGFAAALACKETTLTLVFYRLGDRANH